MIKKVLLFISILLLPNICFAGIEGRAGDSGLTSKGNKISFNIGSMPGLVSHFNLNENEGSPTVIDEKFGNHGTYQDGSDLNTNTGSVTGKINRALDFDGDEFIEVPNVAVLDFTTQMSISCWVKTASAVASPRIGESRDTGAPNHGWTLFIAAGDGSANFQIDSTAAAGGAKVATDITDSAWHHVVGTWDGANILVYLNGVVGSPVAHAGTMAKDVVTRFGRGTQAVAFLTGQIDNIVMFNRAISQTDVLRIFNQDAGRER